MKLPLTVTLNAQDITAYYSSGILPLSCIAALARALDQARPYEGQPTFAEWRASTGGEPAADQCGLCGQQLDADAHCAHCSRPKKRQVTAGQLALGMGEGEEHA